jgi:hypothetical protein
MQIQDVGAHASFEAVMDRAQVDVVDLEMAKVAFDVGQGLVGIDHSDCAGLSIAQRGEWTASSEFSGVRVRSRPSGQRPSDFVMAPKPLGEADPSRSIPGRQLRKLRSCFTTAGLVPNPVVGEVLQFCSGSAGTRRSLTRTDHYSGASPAC